MRVTPDDDIYRTRLVWLGPVGLTFPWVARYLAYGVWLGLFLMILLVEAITPLPFHPLPVWELCISIGLVYWVMGFIDHERPLTSVFQSFYADLTTPRAPKARLVRVVDRCRILPRIEIIHRRSM